MELIRTRAVTVRRPVSKGSDRFGNPVVEYRSEDAARPDGARVAVTVHFPRSYAKTLKGCEVVDGARAYRVVGDPQPYAAENCPGPFGLAAECEAVDG